MILKQFKTLFNNKFKNTILSLQQMPKSQFYVYMTILLFPFLLIIYQGCKKSTLTSIQIPSRDHSNSGETPTDPTPDSTPNPIIYDRGYIVQIDPLTEEVIADSLLSVNSNVTFKFMNTHPDSDNYKWAIKRGFESIITDNSTTVDTYQTSFTQSGAYDVSVESYNSSASSPETSLNTATKRFVVGASCQLTDILEIKLLSGSLTVDGSATFGLKDSDNFSNIQWKATLLPQESSIEETAETIELSFEDEGALIIEVSAISSDPSKSECLTYRSKSFTITSSLSPHFNLITLTDGTNEIATLLENNDIYKYERPTDQYLQIEVLHAHTCEHQIDENDKTEFTCNDALIDISLDEGSSCVEKTIHLFAADETRSQEVSQTYYNYCPQDGSYCYMGPTSKKQSHHVCQAEDDQEDNDQGSGNDTVIHGSCDNSIRNGCNPGIYNDRAISDTNIYYRWHCEGLNGGSTATGCQKQIVQGVIDGVCDNSTRNSCIYGTADDPALEDTDEHYRWQCIGTGGGLTADCQREKLQNP